MARFTETDARLVIGRANEHVHRELDAREREAVADNDADREMYAGQAKLESEISSAIVDLFEDLQSDGQYRCLWDYDESKWTLYRKVD